MNKSLVALCVPLLAVGLAAHAQPRYYPGYGPGYGTPYQAAPAEQEVMPPDHIVRQGIDRLKGFLSRGGSAGEAEVKAFLDKEISPYFDFDYMGQWSAGPLLRQMNDEQKARFAARLKDLFFSALARNLGSYAAEQPRIEVSQPRMRQGGREVTVNARVIPQNGYPTSLEFRFYQSKEGWKVFDVSANGNSAALYYRKYFNELVRREGMSAL